MFKSERLIVPTTSCSPLHLQVGGGEQNSPEAMYDRFLAHQASEDERLMTPAVRRLIFQ